MTVAKLEKIGILAVIVLVVGGILFFPYWTSFERTVTIKDKTAAKDNIYKVTDTNNNTYEVADCWRRLATRSTDTYNLMDIGKSYTISGYGWRIGLFSSYPIITNAVEAN